MKPSISDIVEINQLLSLWGHLLDGHGLDRLDEVLSDDALYDASVFGFACVCGIDAIRAIFNQGGHAQAHHSTNVYVQDGPGDSLIARSKGLGILSNGTAVSATYIDTLRRTPSGWRIASRVLTRVPESESATPN